MLRLDEFSISYVTTQINYPRAFMLWDRAGAVWDEIQSHFNSIELGEAKPNSVGAYLDDRYTASVTMENAFLTDNKPARTFDDEFRPVEVFMDTVTSILNITEVTRIGTRVQYRMVFKDREARTQYALQHGLIPPFPEKLFGTEATTLSPSFHINVEDGKFGYWFRLDSQELVTQFDPPPNAKALRPQKAIENVISIDIDIYTGAPAKISSFRTWEWLERARRLVHRDTPRMLDLMMRARS